MRSLALAAALASISSAPLAGEGRVPVVVELFTSEGCSSCPPADALLLELERTRPVAGVEVVALGLHVTYWDGIGWPDPFGDPAFADRQGRYARALGGGSYTPEMVVDGAVDFPGARPGRRARQARRIELSGLASSHRLGRMTFLGRAGERRRGAGGHRRVLPGTPVLGGPVDQPGPGRGGREDQVRGRDRDPERRCRAIRPGYTATAGAKMAFPLRNS